MKRIVFCLLISLPMQAQFYQRAYQVTGNDFLTCSSPARADNGNYIFAGLSLPVPVVSGVAFLSVVRTNSTGTTSGTGGGYSRRYEMRLNNTDLVPVPRGVFAPLTSVATPTAVNATVGGYILGPGLFSLVTTPTGTVSSALQFMPTITTTEFRVNAACEAQLTSGGNVFTDRVFVTGTININGISPGQGVATYVASINIVTNTVLWFNIYNLNVANENNEREEPSTIRVFDNHLVVAGNAQFSTGTRGYLIGIDPFTGNMLGSPLLFDFSQPTKIRGVSGTNLSSSDFQVRLCGETEEAVDTRDTWVATVATANTPSVLWSKAYDYSGGGDNFGEAVTDGFFPFYVSGTAGIGSLGGDNDKVLLRLDQANGNVIFENTYGKVGNENAGAMNVRVAHNGVVLAGIHSKPSGDAEFSVVSAYLNGVVGCNEASTTVTPTNMPMTLTTTTAQVTASSLTSQNIAVKSGSIGTITTDCNAASVPGGANQRLGHPDENDTTVAAAGVNDLRMFPNPVAAGTPLHLQFEAALMATADLHVYDMQGREVLKETFTLSTGDNAREVNIDQLQAGVYIVVLGSGDQLQRQRLVIQ